MTMKEIKYTKLEGNNYNPRKRFDDAAMNELVDSIKKVGLLEPLVARKNNGEYEVICGVRRYQALGKINKYKKGKKKIPANVVNVDTKQAQILSLAENTARESLTPIEEGRAYANYVGIENVENLDIPSKNTPKVEKLSEQIGVSGDTISKRISLLALPEKVQTMVENKNLGKDKASMIARLKQIDDGSIRSTKMLEFANKAEDSTHKKLNKKISSYIENYKEEQKKEEDMVKEYEENVEDAKIELSKTYSKTYKWMTKNIDEEKIEQWLKQKSKNADKADKSTYTDIPKKIDDDPHSKSKILQEFLNETAAEKTGDQYTELNKKETRIDKALSRYKATRKYLKQEKTTTCPYCGAGATIPKIDERISQLKDEKEGTQSQKEELSETANKLDEKKKSLSKTRVKLNRQQELLEEQKEALSGGE